MLEDNFELQIYFLSAFIVKNQLRSVMSYNQNKNDNNNALMLSSIVPTVIELFYCVVSFEFLTADGKPVVKPPL